MSTLRTDPTAAVPTLPSRTARTASSIGVVAHAVIAELVADAVTQPLTLFLQRQVLTERCLQSAASHAHGTTRTARANAVVAAGWANQYLQHLSPSPDWTVIGAEYDTGDGRVDVAYRHLVTGRVLYDEIKTGYAARSVVDPDWLEQARRYATSGHRTWAESFVGVRVVPLGSLHLTCLVHVGRATAWLRPTREHPDLRRPT